MKKKYLIFIFLASIVFVPLAYAEEAGNTSEVQNRETERTRVRNEAMQSFKDSILDLKNSRVEIRAQKKQVVLEKVQTLAENRIDNLIERYERIQKRVQNMKIISAEKKTEIKATIDEEITVLKGLRSQVEKATSTSEVKVIMLELKIKIKRSVNIIKEIVASIHETHLSDIVSRLVKISDSLKTKVEGLASGGTDTTEMDDLLTKARANLDQANSYIKSDNFAEAKKSIVDARQNLVDLSQKIKAATDDDSEDEEKEGGE